MGCTIKWHVSAHILPYSSQINLSVFIRLQNMYGAALDVICDGYKWGVYIYCLEGSRIVSSISDKLIVTGHHQSYINRSREMNGLYHYLSVNMKCLWHGLHTYAHVQSASSMYQTLKSGRATLFFAVYPSFDSEMKRGVQFTNIKRRNIIDSVTEYTIFAIDRLERDITMIILAVLRLKWTYSHNEIPECT